MSTNTFKRALVNSSIGQLNADGAVEPFTSQSRAGMRYLVRVDDADRVWLDYEDGQTRECALGYREVLQRTRNGMWREVASALASQYGPARTANAAAANILDEESVDGRT